MSIPQSIRRIGPAVALSLASIVAVANDAAYPRRPIVIVVPQAPGGGVDSLARLIMPRLSIALGQPVVIENRVGAGGLIGTRYVAKAANDGYTLLFTSPSHNINAALNEKAGYDALKDFTPVALLGRGPFVLVAHPDFEAKSTAELIAMAKKNPDGIDYGSVGVGSFNHLLGEMFNTEARVKLRHVPYRGSSEAASAVVGGQIPLSFNSLPGALPFIRAGRLRALGVTTPGATPLAPDIPPLSSAVPGYEGSTWYGIVAPAGMPRPIVDKLSGEIQRMLQEPDVGKLMMQLGIQMVYGNPKDFGDLLAAQSILWRKVIKDANVTLGG
ncbi:tripartite tricarboxylate transporter substrate binding protein [Verminephrobacter aporrectodeae]|uniref:Tripartite tricarboxylate transporter substrate binding protein n=1 Tax=Verminephrobacter aporrectodeae subsp. tuberculatae TaxID=1110392 RepID=A0ABT3KYU5_9BURK|nr:tripartite tricarboxylate transporter substrate binding protein [Verminephrobacter aporrectodeae]MCW5219758.1 tripartite tricarboxylate transporter substrate binding protein [Verminephrobacter aporrectodeae subsp. tuberculatae]MCW5258540.1 tripartite tricarboxylate transporter substrate binding protein [Verminephrobacter aporrectodeae subsp. tuberculatae]MCW5287544.1 tripartite tricarboxylate transporter substrate binding protein [Verminephrobacter aporrectodeae subsp. tuberculatae]MCW532352